MSRHFQNYNFEDELDDFEGYHEVDEEDEVHEELSPEDEVQMAQGIAEILSLLGPQADKVTPQQIQDALWHYYYDIDKSVAYLVGKYVDPIPKSVAKPKPVQANPPAKDFWSRNPTIPLATFFSDMPWLNIPEDRRTTFVAPPRHRGGLLGGSSAPKMSKLQMLAAARKRKAEEEATLVLLQKEGNKRSEEQLKSDSLSKSCGREEKSNQVALRKKTKSTPDQQGEAVEKSHATEPTSQGVSLAGVAPSWTSEPRPRPQTDGAFDETIMAQPSAFAQVLCSGSARHKIPVALPSTPETVQVAGLPPWTAFTTPESLREVFEQPSPDDIVLAAQTQSALSQSQLKIGKRVNKPAKGVADATKDVEHLSIVDTSPLPKSKNLDVLKEHNNSKGKKELSFVVVGHVDSGKSTMLGRLLLDMKVVDQRTIDKYQKEAEKLGKSSFALAWVLDSKTEERARGVTIDIATNHFETDATSFTLIDAPGHRDFIPNMLAGTGMADVAVLVVDAAKGAFEAGLKGQTREHALLLRSMGVFRIVVAVNKLDTVQWSTERFEEIRDQILGSLKALKFPLKDISFVPVSGLKGDNVVRRSQDAAASWYTGSTLLEELEQSDSKTKDEDLAKPLRLMLTSIYDTPLSPIIVSGRIDAGSLQNGDAVLVQPSGEKAYIRAIERNGEPADWAVAGQHVALHLSHIDYESHVHTGDVICSIKSPIPCVDSFVMRALAFDTFFPMPVDLSRGRLRAPAFIRELTGTLDINKGTLLKKKPQIIKAGQVARIRVSTEHGKVPMEKGQRLVLRSQGDTVAAGLIE